LDGLADFSREDCDAAEPTSDRTMTVSSLMDEKYESVELTKKKPSTHVEGFSAGGSYLSEFMSAVGVHSGT
jgi:hypothetical protein